MATAQPVPLQCVVGSVPPNWSGDAQALANLLGSILQFYLETGSSTFIIGGSQPTSNQGPWLKDGTTWYVWNDALATYVPATIPQASLRYIISPTAPDPAVYDLWFQTNASTGTPISINHFNAGQWVAFGANWSALVGAPGALLPSVPGFGTTGQRPSPGTIFQVYYDTTLRMPLVINSDGNYVGYGDVVSFGPTTGYPVNPQQNQRFRDTTLNIDVIFYSGSWHTVDGCPGDVKTVKAATLAAALAQNPGWVQDTASIDRLIIGAGNLYAYNATGGATSATLTAANLPSTLPITIPGFGTNGVVTPTEFNLTNSASNPGTGAATMSITGASSTPVPTLPPYIAYWTLVKS